LGVSLEVDPNKAAPETGPPVDSILASGLILTPMPLGQARAGGHPCGSRIGIVGQHVEHGPPEYSGFGANDVDAAL
jgi:hypothetical protein